MVDLKRIAFVLCLILMGIGLVACGKADKLEKLGYSEAEINKFIDSDYANNIIDNKIQSSDFSEIKKHRAFKEENMAGYTAVLNKIYTKDELDLDIIGINALKENSQDYENILDDKNDKIKSSIDRSLAPKITLKSTELNATLTDKGLDYVKSIITVQSYFDGDIGKDAVLEGSFVSNKLGEYNLTVKSKDSKGYQADQSIKFKVVDNEKPTIQLPSTNNLFVGDQIDLMKDVIGRDNYEGDLTNNITVDNSDFTSAKEGTYSVTYKLKDSSNNEITVSRNLTVTPIFKLNDTFELNKYKVTLKAFAYNRTDSEPTDGFYQYYTADEGNTFLITSLNLMNMDNIKRRPFDIVGNEEQKLKVELIYDGSFVYDTAAHGLDNNWHDLFRSVDPLVSATANLAFQIPISVKDSNKSIVLKFSSYESSDGEFYLKIR